MKYKRKKRRANSEVSLEQLKHMGSRLSVRESREKFRKEPGCICSDSEVPTYYESTSTPAKKGKRGKYKRKGWEGEN